MMEEGVKTAAGATISRPILAACYLLSSLLVVSPLFWVSVPPLADYPSYLARMAILGEPGASSNYVVHWQLIPNLAMDLVVPPLSTLVGLETAGRLFIGATMLLLLAGTAFIHRALFCRAGLWPLTSLLFVYNFVLLFGFLNFLFGLGLALLGFGGWLVSARWRTPLRLTVFAFVAAVLFVCHLFAFGVYGLLVGFYEIGLFLAAPGLSPAAFRRHGISSLQFVPAIALWLSNPAAGEPHTTEYGDLFYKVAALRAPMDFGVFGWPLAPVVAMLFLLGWRRGTLRVAPQMRWPILAMMIVAIAMPDLLYGSHWADIRLPVALAFVVVASTRPCVSRIWLSRLVMASVLGLVLVRTVAVTAVWRAMDRHFAEFRGVSRQIPRTSRLLTARVKMPDSFGRIDGVPEWFAALNSISFYHVDDLAILDRDAFLPTLGLQLAPVEPAARNSAISGYSDPPLSLSKLAEGARRPVPVETDREAVGYDYWIGWPNRYDYLLILDFGDHRNPLPDHLQQVAKGSFFTYYKVLPGPDA